MAERPLLDDLPPTLPEDLRAFLECRAERATIANGPVTWVEIPPGARGFLGATPPELAIMPAAAQGTATIRVKAGWVSATLAASVVDGRLSIDTSKLPFLTPGSVRAGIRRFVDEVNDRLALNGKALAEPQFGPDGLTLTKIDRQEAVGP